MSTHSGQNGKIALVMRELSVHAGGGEKFAVNLAKGLLEKGREIEVWAGSLESGLGLDGCFKKISFVKKPSLLKVWSFCSGFHKLLRTESVDYTLGITQVYPVDIYRVGGGIYPHWLSIQYPNPFYRFLHMLIRPVYLLNRMIEWKILTHDRLKKVVVNSKLEKTNLLRYYPIPEDKIDVIYNGVDLELFHPKHKASRERVRRELGVDSEAFVIFFPSNNFKRKGLKTLIHATAELNQKSAMIWVAGKGREAPFHGLAKKLKIGHQILFLKKRSDMEKLYGAADVMVLPTQYDSFSNVVLEALASGLPVITTRNNGAAEAIQQGENGFVLEDYKDAAGLKGFIREVIKNKGKWGSQARKGAEEFTLEKCVSSYAELLATLT
jgi:UDP-glucose:(heptosyl)LPS alpha-1,3-glucosyltransferase